MCPSGWKSLEWVVPELLTSINGLPSHPLFVHAAVTLLPIAVILLLASALWPRARARLGLLTPLGGLGAFVACWVTKEAGERLEHSPLMQGMRSQIHHHAEMGSATAMWSFGVFVLTVLVWAGSSGAVTSRVPIVGVLGGRAGSVVLAVAAVAVSTVGMWALIGAGDSGAHMVWAGL
jgi:hypothetical protein